MIYTDIVKHIERYQKEFHRISEDKRTALEHLAHFMDDKIRSGEKAELVFICTHNSRRSHIGQIWAQTAAAYYTIPGVITYSGGTEVTAFNPKAVNAMTSLGFKITDAPAGDNPVYEVRFDDSISPVKAFSKKYNDASNPNEGFAAIMTCTHADQNCPFIPGAAIRVAAPYDDPKDFDNTSLETAKYLERANEIGRDLVFALSLISKNS